VWVQYPRGNLAAREIDYTLKLFIFVSHASLDVDLLGEFDQQHYWWPNSGYGNLINKYFLKDIISNCDLPMPNIQTSTYALKPNLQQVFEKHDIILGGNKMLVTG